MAQKMPARLWLVDECPKGLQRDIASEDAVLVDEVSLGTIKTVERIG